MSFSFAFGIRALSDDEPVFQNRRFNAASNFAILKFDVSRTQNLAHRLSLFAQVDGQRASEPLIVNEQFLGGGASLPSVRGYLEAEVAGDDGTHAALELRRDLPVEGGLSFLTQFQVLAFTEGVYVTTLDPLPGQVSYNWIASGGLGLRAVAASGVRLRLDLGFPFKSTLYTEAGKPALQFLASFYY
jgi:hemolysin activation/secretion protein